MFLFLPPQNEFKQNTEYVFLSAVIVSLFLFQSLYIFYQICLQCNSDVLLVDWEKPKTDDSSSISMWRKVLIANHFNELQCKRKTSVEVTLFVVCVCSIESLKNESKSINVIEEFASTSCIWILSIAVQRFWQYTFYERFFSEPKSQKFIDLCTLANISLIIFDDINHGYYLHCRAPYEYADCDTEELYNNLKSEGQGFVPSRGLDVIGSPRDCQTFEIFTSEAFQKDFRNVSKDLVLSHLYSLMDLLWPLKLTPSCLAL